MTVTQYVGARYVPLFADPIEWSNETAYEPLTIVIHDGNSYTSRQAVPKGIDIANDEFWALTSNYNAQVESYRKETAKAVEDAGNALSLAKTNEQDIATLDSEMAGTADSGLKTLINAAQNMPITFFNHYISSKQTVLVAKIDKLLVDMELKECNGRDGKWTSNSVEWLQNASDDYFYAVNCDRGYTGSTPWESYNYIIDGKITTGAGVSSSSTNPNYVVFNDINNIDVVSRDDYTISQIKNAGWNNAYVTGLFVLQNGVDRSDEFPDFENRYEPIHYMGWDDSYIYLFLASGRSVYQQGVTAKECAALATKLGCRNLVLNDGGGSICGALKINGSFTKINPAPAVPRNTGLCLAFKFKENAKIANPLNTASLCSIQGFNQAYARNYATFSRVHGSQNVNHKLSAGTTLLDDETLLIDATSHFNRYSTNTGDYGLKDGNITFDFSDWKKGTIWNIKQMPGSSWDMTVMVNGSFSFIAEESGFCNIVMYRRIIKPDGTSEDRQLGYSTGAYTNGRFSATINAFDTIQMMNETDVETYCFAKMYTTTDTTIREIVITECFEMGYM